MTAITTPPRAPKANAFAERWVRTVRHELLDRTLIWNERQRRALLVEFIAHYNSHRPHRSLNQRAPNDDSVVKIESGRTIQRHTACGGLINEYPPPQPEAHHHRSNHQPLTADSPLPATPTALPLNNDDRPRRVLEPFTPRRARPKPKLGQDV